MRKAAGFTLIELLIVIGILGVLAAGLLAAVDPFEQLKKGRDTAARDSVIEFQNAVIRYFGGHGDSPWFSSSGCNMGALSAAAISTLGPCITNLETDGELKTGFLSALGGNSSKIFVTSPTSGALTVCFSPTSKSQFKEDATKYSSSGVDLSATTCSSAAKTNLTPGSTCFWCAK